MAQVEWTDASSDLEIQLHLALRGLGLVVETRDDSNGSLPSPDKFGVGVDLVIANNHEDWHEENDERRHRGWPRFPSVIFGLRLRALHEVTVPFCPRAVTR